MTSKPICHLGSGPAGAAGLTPCTVTVTPATRRRSGRGRGTGAKGGGETGRSQSDPKLPAEAAAKAATAAPLALAVSFLEPAPKVLGPFAAVRDCKLAKSQIRLRLTRWAAGACVRVRVRALGKELNLVSKNSISETGEEEVGPLPPLLQLLPERRGLFLSAARFTTGEKAGNEPEEVKLQDASRQIVQRAILQALQQVSRESKRADDRASDSRGRCQRGGRELTKKHDKK
uniref:Uncharacterized protein n=1 Tax=Cavia porcellus TaxID=10141 RepID=A0A286XJ51_CAVPO